MPPASLLLKFLLFIISKQALTPMSSGTRNAILSGLIGASTSLFTKLSLSPTSPTFQSQTYEFCSSIITSERVCKHSHHIVQALSLTSSLLLNTLMLYLFITSMSKSGSSATVALSTGSNFCATAVIGVVWFGEEVSVIWMGGFAMILGGVWVLRGVESVREGDEEDEEKEGDVNEKKSKTKKD